MNYRLELYQNATDSLNEALRQYELGALTSGRNLKFSILHFSHFMELILKHIIGLNNADLLQKKNGHTISFHEALNILCSVGPSLPDEIITNIKAFKRWRNEIEHSTVNLEPFTVRRAIASILAPLNKNIETHKISLKESVESQHKKLFHHLCNESEVKLTVAQDQALAFSEVDVAYGCYECKQNKVAALIGNSIICLYCNHEIAANA